MDLNGSLFHAINQLAGRSSVVDDAMKFAAQYAIFAIMAFMLLSWFIRLGDDGDRRLAVYTAGAASLIALALALTIQHFYVHQRPFVLRTDVRVLLPHSADASFPSEHATVGFALAAGILWFRARLGLLLMSLAAVVSFSRVFVGVHYPYDVLGGAAVGILSAGVARLLYPLFTWIDRTYVVRLVPEALR